MDNKKYLETLRLYEVYMYGITVTTANCQLSAAIYQLLIANCLLLQLLTFSCVITSGLLLCFTQASIVSNTLYYTDLKTNCNV